MGGLILEYNKRQFQKSNDKRILHKVKKHWVVVSMALLMAIGGKAVSMQINANADTTNNDKAGNADSTQVIKDRINQQLVQSRDQSAQNQTKVVKATPKDLSKQADVLHNRILRNAEFLAQVSANGRVNHNNQLSSQDRSAPSVKPIHVNKGLRPGVNNGTSRDSNSALGLTNANDTQVGDPIADNSSYYNYTTNGSDATPVEEIPFHWDGALVSLDSDGLARHKVDPSKARGDLMEIMPRPGSNNGQIGTGYWHDDDAGSIVYAGDPTKLTWDHHTVAYSDGNGDDMYTDPTKVADSSWQRNRLSNGIPYWSYSYTADDGNPETVNIYENPHDFKTKWTKYTSGAWSDRHGDVIHGSEDNNDTYGAQSNNPKTSSVFKWTHISASDDQPRIGLTFDNDRNDWRLKVDPGIKIAGSDAKGIFSSAYSHHYDLWRHMKSMDLRGLNVSDVTNFAGMFKSDISLQNINLGFLRNDFKGQKASLSHMFSNDYQLKYLDFSDCFRNLTANNLSHMFDGDTGLLGLNMDNLDASAAKSFQDMFRNDTSLSELKLDNIKTSGIAQNMKGMFSGDSALSSLNLSSLNTSGVSDMVHMFKDDRNIKNLDLTNFDTRKAFGSKVTSKEGQHYNGQFGLFRSDYHLTNLEVGSNTELKGRNVVDGDKGVQTDDPSTYTTPIVFGNVDRDGNVTTTKLFSDASHSVNSGSYYFAAPIIVKYPQSSYNDAGSKILDTLDPKPYAGNNPLNPYLSSTPSDPNIQTYVGPLPGGNPYSSSLSDKATENAKERHMLNGYYASLNQMPTITPSNITYDNITSEGATYSNIGTNNSPTITLKVMPDYVWTGYTWEDASSDGNSASVAIDTKNHVATVSSDSDKGHVRQISGSFFNHVKKTSDTFNSSDPNDSLNPATFNEGTPLNKLGGTHDYKHWSVNFKNVKLPVNADSLFDGSVNKPMAAQVDKVNLSGLTNLSNNHVQEASKMFYELPNLTQIDGLSNFRGHDLSDMRQMFSSDGSLHSLDDLNLYFGNSSNQINMSDMFANDTNMIGVTLDGDTHVSSGTAAKDNNLFKGDNALRKLTLSVHAKLNNDTSDFSNVPLLKDNVDGLGNVTTSVVKNGTQTIPGSYYIATPITLDYQDTQSPNQYSDTAAINYPEYVSTVTHHISDGVPATFPSDKLLKNQIPIIAQTDLPKMDHHFSKSDGYYDLLPFNQQDYGIKHGSNGAYVIVKVAETDVWSGYRWGDADVTINGTTHVITINGKVRSDAESQNTIEDSNPSYNGTLKRDFFNDVIRYKNAKNKGDTTPVGKSLHMLPGMASVGPGRTQSDVDKINHDWQVVFNPGIVIPKNSSYLFDAYNESDTEGHNPKGDNPIASDIASIDMTKVIFSDMIGPRHTIKPGTSEQVSHMFRGLPSLTTPKLGGALFAQLTNLTNVSYLFSRDPALQNLDLTNFGTRNVTNMNSVFESDAGLNEIDLGPYIDTRNVTTMRSMLANDPSLKSLDLSKFSTPKVTDMSNMFTNDSGLSYLNISNLDTSHVGGAGLTNIFKSDNNLSKMQVNSATQLDKDGWDAQWGNLSNGGAAFFNCIVNTNDSDDTKEFKDNNQPSGIYFAADNANIHLVDPLMDKHGLPITPGILPNGALVDPSDVYVTNKHILMPWHPSDLDLIWNPANPNFTPADSISKRIENLVSSDLDGYTLLPSDRQDYDIQAASTNKPYINAIRVGNQIMAQGLVKVVYENADGSTTNQQVPASDPESIYGHVGTIGQFNPHTLLTPRGYELDTTNTSPMSDFKGRIEPGDKYKLYNNFVWTSGKEPVVAFKATNSKTLTFTLREVIKSKAGVVIGASDVQIPLNNANVGNSFTFNTNDHNSITWNNDNCCLDPDDSRNNPAQSSMDVLASDTKDVNGHYNTYLSPSERTLYYVDPNAMNNITVHYIDQDNDQVGSDITTSDEPTGATLDLSKDSAFNQTNIPKGYTYNDDATQTSSVVFGNKQDANVYVTGAPVTMNVSYDVLGDSTPVNDVPYTKNEQGTQLRLGDRVPIWQGVPAGYSIVPKEPTEEVAQFRYDDNGTINVTVDIVPSSNSMKLRFLDADSFTDSDGNVHDPNGEPKNPYVVASDNVEGRPGDSFDMKDLLPQGWYFKNSNKYTFSNSNKSQSDQYVLPCNARVQIKYVDGDSDGNSDVLSNYTYDYDGSMGDQSKHQLSNGSGNPMSDGGTAPQGYTLDNSNSDYYQFLPRNIQTQSGTSDTMYTYYVHVHRNYVGNVKSYLHIIYEDHDDKTDNQLSSDTIPVYLNGYDGDVDHITPSQLMNENSYQIPNGYDLDLIKNNENAPLTAKFTKDSYGHEIIDWSGTGNIISGPNGNGMPEVYLKAKRANRDLKILQVMQEPGGSDQSIRLNDYDLDLWRTINAGQTEPNQNVGNYYDIKPSDSSIPCPAHYHLVPKANVSLNGQFNSDLTGYITNDGIMSNNVLNTSGVNYPYGDKDAANKQLSYPGMTSDGRTHGINVLYYQADSDTHDVNVIFRNKENGETVSSDEYKSGLNGQPQYYYGEKIDYGNKLPGGYKLANNSEPTSFTVDDHDHNGKNGTQPYVVDVVPNMTTEYSLPVHLVLRDPSDDRTVGTKLVYEPVKSDATLTADNFTADTPGFTPSSDGDNVDQNVSIQDGKLDVNSKLVNNGSDAAHVTFYYDANTTDIGKINVQFINQNGQYVNASGAETGPYGDAGAKSAANDQISSDSYYEDKPVYRDETVDLTDNSLGFVPDGYQVVAGQRDVKINGQNQSDVLLVRGDPVTVNVYYRYGSINEGFAGSVNTRVGDRIMKPTDHDPQSGFMVDPRNNDFSYDVTSKNDTQYINVIPKEMYVPVNFVDPDGNLLAQSGLTGTLMNNHPIMLSSDNSAPTPSDKSAGQQLQALHNMGYHLRSARSDYYNFNDHREDLNHQYSDQLTSDTVVMENDPATVPVKFVDVNDPAHVFSDDYSVSGSVDNGPVNLLSGHSLPSGYSLADTRRSYDYGFGRSDINNVNSSNVAQMNEYDIPVIGKPNSAADHNNQVKINVKELDPYGHLINSYSLNDQISGRVDGKFYLDQDAFNPDSSRYTFVGDFAGISRTNLHSNQMNGTIGINSVDPNSFTFEYQLNSGTKNNLGPVRIQYVNDRTRARVASDQIKASDIEIPGEIQKGQVYAGQTISDVRKLFGVPSGYALKAGQNTSLKIKGNNMPSVITLLVDPNGSHSSSDASDNAQPIYVTYKDGDRVVKPTVNLNDGNVYMGENFDVLDPDVDPIPDGYHLDGIQTVNFTVDNQVQHHVIQIKPNASDTDYYHLTVKVLTPGPNGSVIPGLGGEKDIPISEGTTGYSLDPSQYNPGISQMDNGSSDSSYYQFDSSDSYNYQNISNLSNELNPTSGTLVYVAKRSPVKRLGKITVNYYDGDTPIATNLVINGNEDGDYYDEPFSASQIAGYTPDPAVPSGVHVPAGYSLDNDQDSVWNLGGDGSNVTANLYIHGNHQSSKIIVHIIKENPNGASTPKSDITHESDVSDYVNGATGQTQTLTASDYLPTDNKYRIDTSEGRDQPVTEAINADGSVTQPNVYFYYISNATEDNVQPIHVIYENDMDHQIVSDGYINPSTDPKSYDGEEVSDVTKQVRLSRNYTLDPNQNVEAFFSTDPTHIKLMVHPDPNGTQYNNKFHIIENLYNNTGRHNASDLIGTRVQSDDLPASVDGTSFTVTPPNINGYIMMSGDNRVRVYNTKYGLIPQNSVVYNYQAKNSNYNNGSDTSDAQPIIVTYKCNGRVIPDRSGDSSDRLDGYTGETVNVTDGEIPNGYHLKGDQKVDYTFTNRILRPVIQLEPDVNNYAYYFLHVITRTPGGTRNISDRLHLIPIHPGQSIRIEPRISDTGAGYHMNPDPRFYQFSPSDSTFGMPFTISDHNGKLYVNGASDNEKPDSPDTLYYNSIFNPTPSSLGTITVNYTDKGNVVKTGVIDNADSYYRERFNFSDLESYITAPTGYTIEPNQSGSVIMGSKGDNQTVNIPVWGYDHPGGNPADKITPSDTARVTIVEEHRGADGHSYTTRHSVLDPISGANYDSYVLDPNMFTPYNYQPDSGDRPIQGVIDPVSDGGITAKTATFYYHASSDAHPIYVNYINQNGQSIIGRKQINGNYGDQVDVTKQFPIPSDYLLNNNQQTVYTFGREDQDINIMVTGKPTVNYYNVHLTKLNGSDASTYSDYYHIPVRGRIGDAVTIDPRAYGFPHYHVDPADQPATVILRKNTGESTRPESDTVNFSYDEDDAVIHVIYEDATTRHHYQVNEISLSGKPGSPIDFSGSGKILKDDLPLGYSLVSLGAHGTKYENGDNEIVMVKPNITFGNISIKYVDVDNPGVTLASDSDTGLEASDFNVGFYESNIPSNLYNEDYQFDKLLSGSDVNAFHKDKQTVVIGLSKKAAENLKYGVVNIKYVNEAGTQVGSGTVSGLDKSPFYIADYEYAAPGGYYFDHVKTDGGSGYVDNFIYHHPQTVTIVVKHHQV